MCNFPEAVTEQVSGRIGPGHLVLWTSRMGPGAALTAVEAEYGWEPATNG